MKVTGRKKGSQVSLELNETSLSLTVSANGKEWSWADNYQPFIQLVGDEKILFTDAASIQHQVWDTGLGIGIRSDFRGFQRKHLEVPFAFSTIMWVEDSTGDVFFEWVPLNDDGLDVKAVHWPGHMAFEETSDKYYTVLPYMQGLLIPNNHGELAPPIPFNGQMCTIAAYMPWFGQVRPNAGYIAICLQPYDAAYNLLHEENAPYYVGIRWLPSLGKMDYRRVIRYTFLDDCDYNDLCKVYRKYGKEIGHFTSLAEKAAKNPRVDKLIGSVVVHNGIKTHIAPGSDFYDKEHPEKNDVLFPFSERTEKIRHIKEKGVEKLYFHLDGWGQPGYDNQHPDYLPACKEAGGWEGFKELSDTMQECGYMLGVHDQYRDYYFDAATFNEDFAARNPDGSIFEMSRWAGGHQTYLCATQAPYYVKRNFSELFEHGIPLEASYLDVFTCNEPDECSHPLHRMTRKECLEFRARCFDYLTSQGIVPSSEEVTDWAMKSLVFAHYGPYEFMMRAPGSKRFGISVPLYNLVYHDCMILPWFMDRLENTEDYMLYAVLNGGIPYLDKDGAYPDTDGAFDSDARERKLEEDIARCKVVTELHERIAKCEMVRHEFLNDDHTQQRTTFSDGTQVTIDTKAQTYDIKLGE